MEAQWTCPICRNARDDVAYALPCGHQFCLGCIARWAEINPECPICRGSIEIIRFSVLAEDDYLQLILTNISYVSIQEQAVLAQPVEIRHHHPVAPPPSPQEILSPDEQGAVRAEAMGGLLPHVWAELFQREEHLLDPVLPWLHQELTRIYGAQWWRINTAVSIILYILCLSGPDEETMVQVLQPALREHTAAVVHGVISIIVHHCSEEAQRLLLSSAAEEEDNSPASSPASSPRSTSSSSSGRTPPINLDFSNSPEVSQHEGRSQHF